jgi:hypothetical protein
MVQPREKLATFRQSRFTGVGIIKVYSRWSTRPSERSRKLLAIGEDNLAEMHQRLAVLGGIADRGNFVAGL